MVYCCVFVSARCYVMKMGMIKSMAVSFPRLPRWLCGGGGNAKKESKGSPPSLKKTTKRLRKDGLGEEEEEKMGNVVFPEPDDPEWSIGWVEPHGPGFKSEDDTGGGFVVLVPCYKKVMGGSGNQILNGFFSTAPDGKNMEQLLSSIRKL
ncbi:hypothetical protein Bca52824_020016 [Brassica carinata]|uniref:Uncharacterized protein n=1 Tax=Brassica carinata TaxID=52824 RepID=A0A8X7VSW4_BRACI|nr:hypothetical protein Bca52824_020016 [Brassica carinata]